MHYLLAALGLVLTNPDPPAMSILLEVRGGTAQCPRFAWTSIEAESLPEQVVVLIHGLDEPGDIWNTLAPALAHEGLPALRFEYRDDGEISRASADLIHALEDLKLRGVKSVTLIGHSMGGLVALDAVTRPDGYSSVPNDQISLPSVLRLITIATPFDGSALAPMRAPLEIRDRAADLLRAPIVQWKTVLNTDDGAGEAATDLTPGSDFLRGLRSRGVPQGLAFTTIVARIGDDVKDSIGELVDGEIARDTFGGATVDSWLRELGKGSDAVGDGVVSMESACAIACDDVVVVSGTHRGVIRGLSFVDIDDEITKCDESNLPPAVPAVLQRMKRHR